MHDNINSPSHYTDGGVETIDFIEGKGLGYHEGNIIKYVTRWKLKGGVEDLKKARWYLNRLISQHAPMSIGQLKNTECFRTPEELEKYLDSLNTITYDPPMTETYDPNNWAHSHIPTDITGKPFEYPRGWPYTKTGKCEPCKGRGKNGTCTHGED